MGLNAKQKPLFEILNTFWNLLKPYANVNDAKVYKQIMSDEFGLIFKDRGEKYTDEWWDSTRDLIDYPERYKGTKYVDFAAELTVAFLDYFQFDMKMIRDGNKATYYNFMTYVGRAFLSEWERLRSG